MFDTNGEEETPEYPNPYKNASDKSYVNENEITRTLVISCPVAGELLDVVSTKTMIQFFNVYHSTCLIKGT